MVRRLRPLLVAGLAMTVFDAAATYLWLRSGLALEGNPVLARTMERVGVEAALLGRAGVGTALLLALYFAAHEVGLARAGLAVVAVALSGAGVWHVLGVATLLT